MADIFFRRMVATLNPSDACVWVPLPDKIIDAIRRWQAMLEQAIPIAKLNDDLKISMIEGLYSPSEAIGPILSAAANSPPMLATAMRFEERRVDQNRTDLVITVECPDLCDLHQRITGCVAYPVGVGVFTPCIHIASFENAMIDFAVFNELKAAGVIGVNWIIEFINAGTPHGYKPCIFYGHAPMRFVATTSETALFGKAAGMSTLDMESGGGLVDTEFSIDIADEEDEDNEEEDKDDDAWMNRAIELSETLDGEY
jgi:hypothetical protein